MYSTTSSVTLSPSPIHNRIGRFGCCLLLVVLFYGGKTWDRVGLIMPAPCCAIIELSVQKIFVLDICTFMRNKVTRKYFFKQIPWSNESAFPLRNLFLPMISWPRKRIYGLIIDLLLSPFLSGLERHYPSFLQWILADIATNDEGIDTFTSIFCFPPTEGVPRIRSVTKKLG